MYGSELNNEKTVMSYPKIGKNTTGNYQSPYVYKTHNRYRDVYNERFINKLTVTSQDRNKNCLFRLLLSIVSMSVTVNIPLLCPTWGGGVASQCVRGVSMFCIAESTVYVCM